MNVLFYTNFEVSVQKGGTERITARIANELQHQHHINCYSIYNTPIGANFERFTFKYSERLPLRKKSQENLKKFLLKYDIDIIINQGSFYLMPIFYEAKKVNPKIKLILVHHFSPGTELNFITFSDLYTQWEKNKFSWKTMINLLLFPYRKIKMMYCLPKNYHNSYLQADRIVLLSVKFKEKFMSFARLKSGKKITFIHNALSFDSFLNIQNLPNKKKEVLIVSRLEEIPKKISTALKIWRHIELDPELHDWELKIVGHGLYENKYKQYVKKHNLQRVSFEGIQKPEKYYQEASLFMMTSDFEGWGLTLTESQQFGCVPIAFNNYSSLTDIIVDSQNGYIIPSNDISQYADKMIFLMKNKAVREQLAINAIHYSKQFSIDRICQQWVKLFTELIHETQ